MRRPNRPLICHRPFNTPRPADTNCRHPPDDWWRTFQDPELNQPVEAVMANNLDIRKAVAAVLEVRAQFGETRADRWPILSIEARASKTRQTASSVLSGTTTATMESYSFVLPATFELDLRGRLAWAEDGLRAQLLAVEENRMAVVQTVAAETVNLYLSKMALEREIDVTRRSVRGYRDSLVLEHKTNALRGTGMDALRALQEAGAVRFRAIVLTSLTIFAGLTPMLLERSIQACFLIPMAVSLSFGVLFATVMTLILVPCGYLIMDDLQNRTGVRRFAFKEQPS